MVDVENQEVDFGGNKMEYPKDGAVCGKLEDGKHLVVQALVHGVEQEKPIQEGAMADAASAEMDTNNWKIQEDAAEGNTQPDEMKKTGEDMMEPSPKKEEQC